MGFEFCHMVEFEKYCKNCKHYDKNNEHKEPCNECLDEIINYGTDKPVKFEKKEK